MIIAIDFDGTITEDVGYPAIGPLKPHVKGVINLLVDEGDCIIINTCRDGDEAEEVKKYLKTNGIKYMHFNENCNIRKKLHNNDTRKLGCDITIDDKGYHEILYGIDWPTIYKNISFYKEMNQSLLSRCICKDRNNFI